MPDGLKYSMEELHEIHKRLFLNQLMSYQRDNADGMISAQLVNLVVDNCERVLDALDKRGYV